MHTHTLEERENIEVLTLTIVNVREGFLNYCCILAMGKRGASGKSEAPYLDKKKGMRTGKVVGVQLTSHHYKTPLKKKL